LAYSSRLHRSLAEAYKALAAFFLGPARLEEIEARRGVAEALKRSGEGLLSSPCIEAGEEIRGLADALEGCLSDPGCWHSFNTDFTEVAIAGPRGPPCPLYESAYRVNPHGKHKIIAAPSISNSLEEYYAKLGLEAVEGMGVTVDHASVELEFLAALHEVEAELLDKGESPSLLEEVRGLRRDFLVDHALAWMPALAECIEAESRTNLAKRLAAALRGVLDCETLLYA
jgi:TorA maturation chaperone TorD